MSDLKARLANIGTTMGRSENGWNFRTGAPQDGNYLCIGIQSDPHGSKDSHQLIITTDRVSLMIDLSGIELAAFESIVEHHKLDQHRHVEVNHAKKEEVAS